MRRLKFEVDVRSDSDEEEAEGALRRGADVPAASSSKQQDPSITRRVEFRSVSAHVCVREKNEKRIERKRKQENGK